MKKIIFWTLFILGLPLSAFAQASNGDSFVPLSNVPGLGLTPGSTATPSLPTFLNSLYFICIGIAVVLTVLQLIRAGITYMTASGNIGSTEEAKHLISASLLGLLLVLSPYIVFSIINPGILSLKIDTSGITTSAPTPAAPGTQTGGPAASNGDTVSCTAYTQGIAINKPTACSVHGSDFVAAPNNCCSVVNADTQTCCAEPTASATAYAWVGQYSISSSQPGAGPSNQILHGGPFATQAACYADAGNVSTKYPGKTVTLADSGYTCTCDKPASQQGNACQVVGF